MAYNRKNKLTLIVDVQRITLEHTVRGVPQQWVYDNLIFPKYRISRATFYSYLGIPAKRELTKIQETEHPQLEFPT
ncbi:MAG: hypothetical protein RSC11_08135 [Mucinivorans sp.]